MARAATEKSLDVHLSKSIPSRQQYILAVKCETNERCVERGGRILCIGIQWTTDRITDYMQQLPRDVNQVEMAVASRC